jgi:hypothetical protein
MIPAVTGAELLWALGAANPDMHAAKAERVRKHVFNIRQLLEI